MSVARVGGRAGTQTKRSRGGDKLRPRFIPEVGVRLDVGVAHVQRPELEAFDSLLGIEAVLRQQSRSHGLGVKARVAALKTLVNSASSATWGSRYVRIRSVSASRSLSMSENLRFSFRPSIGSAAHSSVTAGQPE